MGSSPCGGGARRAWSRICCKGTCMAERASGNGAGSDQHAQRLSAPETRIARVAHELNAPVSLIAGSLGHRRRDSDAAVALCLRRPGLIAARATAPSQVSATTMHPRLRRRQRLAPCDVDLRGRCDRASGTSSNSCAFIRAATATSFGAELIDLAAELDRARAGSAGRGALRRPNLSGISPACPPLTGDAHTLGQALVNVLITRHRRSVGDRPTTAWLPARAR